MGKYGITLSDYVNTQYILEPHPICQVDSIALQVPFFIIRVFSKIVSKIALKHDLNLVTQRRQRTY